MEGIQLSSEQMMLPPSMSRYRCLHPAWLRPSGIPVISLKDRPVERVRITASLASDRCGFVPSATNRFGAQPVSDLNLTI